jgi:hypothetical protein|tara:strand:- start:147 stop:536 length:390 start_codon:yes stop_codon:yes gene_type:complete
MDRNTFSNDHDRSRSHSMPTVQLPAGFGQLSTFVERWALPSTVARMRERDAATMDDIQKFYNHVTPYLQAALEHLKSVPYTDDMNAANRNLLNLCLSIAEIAPAVEWYGQPQVIDGYAGSVLTLTSELP